MAYELYFGNIIIHFFELLYILHHRRWKLDGFNNILLSFQRMIQYNNNLPSWGVCSPSLNSSLCLKPFFYLVDIE